MSGFDLQRSDLAAIFEGVPQAYLVLDADLVIVAASDRYLAITDRTREDIVGRHILSAFPENPEDPGAVEQGALEISLRHVLATGKTHAMNVIQYDIPRDERDGGGFEKRFWIPVHHPILGADGKVRFIVQDPSDVTERVVGDKAADARLRIALHAADLGSWDYEPETDLFRRSPAVDEMFGFAPGETGPLAATFFQRMHPDDLPVVMRTLQDALDRPDKTMLRFDYRTVDAAGRVRHIASRGEVLRMSDGKTRMLGVMTDITTERLRETALAEALHVQERLLAQKQLLLTEVNHRVKNSLQIVVSALSLQSRQIEDPAAQAAFRKAVSRVRAITSVHESLYGSDDPLVVDMEVYLRRLCADLAEGSERTGGIDVRVDRIELLAEKAIPIALIVNEFVTNAMKYAYPEGHAGPIVLSLKRKEDDMIELSVADEGVGMTGPVTEGLGTRLVAAMARQLSGKFETGGSRSGHRACVRFPGRIV